MVKRIVGYDEDGNKVFDREARVYDKGMGSSFSLFGAQFSVGDIIKAIPIITICISVYTNQQLTNARFLDSITKISQSTENNAQAIAGMKDVLGNLNNYLSSKTGKQFKDGLPR